MKAISWKTALERFKHSPKTKTTPKTITLIKRALNVYVRPALDPNSPPSLRPKLFDAYCANASAKTLVNALEIFNQRIDLAIADKQISPNTKRTYSWPLTRFLDWMKNEPWFQELFPPPLDHPLPRCQGITRKESQGKKKAYMLKRDQLLPNIEQHLSEFQKFWMEPGRAAKRRRRGEDPIRTSTYTKVKEYYILCFFGWLVNIKGHDLQELSLALLLDINLIEAYLDWLIDVRKANHSAGVILIQAAISVAKFLHHDQQPSPSVRHRRNWSDVEVIEDLRSLEHECQDEYRIEKKRNEAQKWAKKELTHAEAREVVCYLRQYRSLCYGNKRGRHPSAVAWDFQRYLGVKFLTYSPVRQEEIRNLNLGSTLFRKIDKKGNPYYEVRYSPDEHKLGSKTHKGRHYRLPSILTQDLDDWFNIWRPQIVEALKSQDNWLTFWGQPVDRMERLQKALENAKQGKVCANVKISVEDYITQLENKISALTKRIDCRLVAKENFEHHNGIFILMGSHKNPEGFGKPTDGSNFWSMITNAVAFATKNLYGEEKWLNPHAFRHLADKHVRQCGRGNNKVFDHFIGHSEKMGDEYAEQIMSEFEETEHIVDNWWEDTDEEDTDE